MPSFLVNCVVKGIMATLLLVVERELGVRKQKHTRTRADQEVYYMVIMAKIYPVRKRTSA